ncbi:MAG: DNA repair protein RecN [Deltaproteobacteria bacterium]|nr:DNA repair protein RecN [Deltaproteobacteria bacterium]
MLLELNIKDLAIIADLSIEFAPGLNVFTGETGAGKSIIIGAIDLILGDRASNEMIRSAKEEARVEAMFDVSENPGLRPALESSGIPHSDTLVIKRLITRGGKNRVFINGCISTLSALADVGSRLVDVCGQSEHQSLARDEDHVEMLDAFGCLGDLRRAMSDAFARWSALKRELDALTEGARKAASDLELLEFQFGEIEEAGLKEGEEEALRAEGERLKNIERLRAATHGAEEALYSGEASVIEKLAGMARELKDASRFDLRLEDQCRRIEAARYELEDAAGFLRDYSSGCEGDPARIEEIESRLDCIARLRKKYGATIKEILEKKKAIGETLRAISGHDERLVAVRGEMEKAASSAASAAAALTEARLKKAKELKKGMERELKELGMAGTVFEAVVQVERNPDSTPRFGEKGADRVIFLISPNPGEETKPLSRIASGGELSRIMLAMKSLSSAGRVPTLIFDEVDTGIGARMAEAVGGKLKVASAAHQVICITHLAQIAAFADAHYFVEKVADGEKRTVTRVKRLAAGERVEHVARLLAGAKITETARKHAMELLTLAGSKARPNAAGATK